MDSPDPYLPDICLEESLVPVQWFGRNRRHDQFAPERRLLAAAFESHLDDYRYVPRAVGHQSQTRREVWHLQAVDWVRDDGEAPLSFRWFCNALKLEPQAVRARLRQKAVSPVERTPNKGPTGRLTMPDRRRRWAT
jgi:hypothetical protein